MDETWTEIEFETFAPTTTDIYGTSFLVQESGWYELGLGEGVRRVS